MKPDNPFTRRGMFPWALLPGELRNIISAYTLTTDQAIHMSANRSLRQRWLNHKTTMELEDQPLSHPGEGGA